MRVVGGGVCERRRNVATDGSLSIRRAGYVGGKRTAGGSGAAQSKAASSSGREVEQWQQQQQQRYGGNAGAQHWAVTGYKDGKPSASDDEGSGRGGLDGESADGGEVWFAANICFCFGLFGAFFSLGDEGGGRSRRSSRQVEVGERGKGGVGGLGVDWRRWGRNLRWLVGGRQWSVDPMSGWGREGEKVVFSAAVYYFARTAFPRESAYGSARRALLSTGVLVALHAECAHRSARARPLVALQAEQRRRGRCGWLRGSRAAKSPDRCRDCRCRWTSPQLPRQQHRQHRQRRCVHPPRTSITTHHHTSPHLESTRCVRDGAITLSGRMTGGTGCSRWTSVLASRWEVAVAALAALDTTGPGKGVALRNPPPLGAAAAIPVRGWRRRKPTAPANQQPLPPSPTFSHMWASACNQQQ